LPKWGNAFGKIHMILITQPWLITMETRKMFMKRILVSEVRMKSLYFKRFSKYCMGGYYSTYN
jgi:hypothetical protein